jgi:transcriptional antiterminator NusG
VPAEEVPAEEVPAEDAPEAVAPDVVAIDPADGLGMLVRAVVQAEASDAREDAGVTADGVEGEVVAQPAEEAEIEIVAEPEPVPEPEPVRVVPAPVQPVENDGMNWYVIHTYSGYERKVKQSLEERVRTLGLEEQVAELLIPTEDVVEMKGGRKVVTAKKFFPGYLLIRMEMNEDLWHVVKNTPRVTGFVGAGRKPIPLPQDEVDKIVNRMEESVEAPKPKFQFSKAETVRIIDGPFTNFTGKVEDVDARRSTLKVMVSIFGRNTPVELDFFQVEKV